jgi:predicted NACHT family NTPase
VSIDGVESIPAKICYNAAQQRTVSKPSAMPKPPNAELYATIDAYLGALREYAGEVRIPGLDISSRPIPIDQIFIEPRLTLTERPTPPENTRAGLQDPTSEPLESASAVLAREQLVVLLGEPGRRKSTLLRQYAWKLASDADCNRVPILVELGRKPERTQDASAGFAWLYERLPELVRAKLGQHGWSHLGTIINCGKASVLLDGFDELGRDGQRQVCELIPALKGNKVVLASRPREYRLTPLAGFKVYDLLELTPKQTEALARTAVEVLARQYGEMDYQIPLQTLVEFCHGAAQSMARNPLLLSFMCLTAISTYARSGEIKLPTRPIPLIRECIEALVTWQRDHRPGLRWPDTLTSKEVIATLGKLALGTFKAQK